MIYGIVGLVALFVGWFIALPILWIPLALILGIVGVYTEQSKLAFATTICGLTSLIGMTLAAIGVVDAVTYARYVIFGIFDTFLVGILILLLLAIPAGLIIYPFYERKPLIKTPMALLIVLAGISVLSLLTIGGFFVEEWTAAVIIVYIFCVASDIALIINLIYSLHCRDMIKSNPELWIKYHRVRKKIIAYLLSDRYEVWGIMIAGAGIIMLLLATVEDVMLIPGILCLIIGIAWWGICNKFS